MRKFISQILLLILFTLFTTSLTAVQRFPKPEFETGYTQPVTQMPVARALLLEYMDVLVLILSLSIITWLIIKKRSRRGVLIMTIFSLIYFGFYRKGCICSVGSIQNITLALFHSEYHIPLTALAFFIVPLLYTLFFGRTFCAGICPLGAIQDIIALRPMSLKSWVNSLLSIIPYLYLGLAVLFAATGSDFIICRYDPFVGIFRFNATFMMFAIGGILLLVGVFIARPYCRFLCPYSVLLNLASRVSWRHLSITPTHCINCRLCENSCPFDAIQKPTPMKIKEKRDVMVKRFIFYFLITPLLIIFCGWAGSRFHENMAKVNPKVRLANELLMNKKEVTTQITTFKSSGKSVENLYSEAASITRQFYWGGWILGGFIGLVLGLILAKLSIFHYREGYTPNKGTCLSCARCVDYCPIKEEK